MNTDTSDEAFQAWTRETFDIYSRLACWQEAVRRCEAQMEERERKAYLGGFDDGVNRGLKGYPTNPYEGFDAYRAFKEAEK